MAPPYKFLVHHNFQEQMDAFLENNMSIWGSFIDQCRKACSDPFKAGKPLKYVAYKVLRGKIRRLQVGGRKGHRFIFIVYRPKEIILPVYLSQEIKKGYRLRQDTVGGIRQANIQRFDRRQ